MDDSVLFQLDGSSAEVTFARELRASTSLLDLTQEEELLDATAIDVNNEEELLSLDSGDEEEEQQQRDASFVAEEQMNAELGRDMDKAESVEERLQVQFSQWLLRSTQEGRLLSTCESKFPAWLTREMRRVQEREERMYGDSSEKQHLLRQIELLRSESDTWRLFSDLYKRSSELHAEEAQLLAQQAETPYKRLYFLVQGGNAALTRQFKVINWLELSARRQLADSSPIQNDQYREHSVRARKPHVDPDASAGMASEDTEFEEQLLRRVWMLVRCGLIEQAITELQRCQHFWRAGSLRSWQSYHNVKLVNPDNRSEPVTVGNSNPEAWLKACEVIARDSSRSVYERALYGLFCGDKQAVLSACHSFEDVLWAHYREAFFCGSHDRPAPMTEAQIFETVSAEPTLQGKGLQFFPLVQRKLIRGDVRGLCDFLVSQLQRPECPALIRRFGCTAMLVLSRLHPEDGHARACAAQGVHILARHIGSDVEVPAVVALHARQLPSEQAIELYSDHAAMAMTNARNRQLEIHRQLQGAEGEQVIHRLLTRKRIRYLDVGRTAGLSPVALAGRVIAKLPADRDASHTYVDGLSAREEAQIDVVHWLSQQEELLPQAIVKCNALARQLALAQRIPALTLLLDEIPRRALVECERACALFVQRAVTDERLRQESSHMFEFRFWHCVMEAWRRHQSWSKVFHEEQPRGQPPAPLGDISSLGIAQQQAARVRHEHATENYELEVGEWRRECSLLAEVAERALRVVIEFPASPLFDGINFGGAGLAPEQGRQAELSTLRKTLIPDMFTLLHGILTAQGKHRQAMQLADLVAAERTQLYLLFCHGRRLDAFMRLMQQSAIENLKEGKDELGY